MHDCGWICGTALREHTLRILPIITILMVRHAQTCTMWLSQLTIGCVARLLQSFSISSLLLLRGNLLIGRLSSATAPEHVMLVHIVVHVHDMCTVVLVWITYTTLTASNANTSKYALICVGLVFGCTCVRRIEAHWRVFGVFYG